MRIAAFIMCLLLTIMVGFVHASRLQGAKYRKLALLFDGRDQPGLVLVAAIKGLQVNPFNKRLHGYAATALMDLKQYPAALMHLDIMLKYYPYELNALINSAFANFYTSNLDKAFEMRDRVKIVKPNYVKK